MQKGTQQSYDKPIETKKPKNKDTKAKEPDTSKENRAIETESSDEYGEEFY